ncbi:hypothetical protein BDW02DRAFT_330137 [Decorospora gaudefroyi]|uniref:Uncharacterized protein n=1 Tax=Decorospora gaudefroyi TaxID=184978 RepID=A0A6A5KJM6_9PLEO|nr:hypothetical protein BDW02DRAFT_330137 [Decorospora gaudefroyi]
MTTRDWTEATLSLVDVSDGTSGGGAEFTARTCPDPRNLAECLILTRTQTDGDFTSLKTTKEWAGILTDTTPPTDVVLVVGSQATDSNINTKIPRPDPQPQPHTHSTSSSRTIDTTPSASISTSETTPLPSLASAQSPSNGSNNTNNLSSGAIAGIAISTLILGAILAFLTTFLLFKRRNKANITSTRYPSYTDSTPNLVMKSSSGGGGGRGSPYVQVSQTPIPPAPMVPPVPAVTSSDAAALALLPRPATATEIKHRLTALFAQIHNHIDTYYRDVHASITSSMVPDLLRFGAQEVDMADLLRDCAISSTPLKHALAAYVVGVTAPEGDGEAEGEGVEQRSLWPAGLLGGLGGDGDGDDPNTTLATTLYRRFAIYIYTHTHPHLPTQSNIREAAEHFSLTFFPWANPTASDQEKDEHLARILADALEVRIWLLGQPGRYAFVWEDTGRRGVLVSPAVVRDGRERVMEGVVCGV